MAGLGWQELVIVLVIVVIIFGAGKLPEIGGALGKGIKEFKSQATEDETQPVSAKATGSGSGNVAAEPRVVENREVRAEEI
jgi:sec-independent protein translocase protein TatA